MVTLILFAATVLVLTPLIQRDCRHAVERRRLRALADRLSPRFANLGRIMNTAGFAAFAAGASFKETLAAVRKAEQAMAKVRAIVNMSPEELRWKLLLEHERSLAFAHLGLQLDKWCRSYGWNPVEVWRTPRALEVMPIRIQDQVDAFASYRVNLHYRLQMEAKLRSAASVFKGISL